MGKGALNAVLSKKHYGSLKQLSPTFIKSPPQAVTQHIKAIYEEGELEQNTTCESYFKFNKKVAVRDQFLPFNDRDVLQGAGKVS